MRYWGLTVERLTVERLTVKRLLAVITPKTCLVVLTKE
jgi:hypothetical protein